MLISHSTILRLCISYLLLPDIDIPDHPYPIKDEQYLFLPYAYTYWPFHYISQGAVTAGQSRKDTRILYHLASRPASVWVPIYFQHRLQQED